MPKKYPVRRRMRGRGKTWNKIKNWLSGANSWLRKNKVLSGLAGVYGSTGLPYSQNVKYAGQAGKVLGYGRKRRVTMRRSTRGRGLYATGSGLYATGGSLAPVGSGRYSGGAMVSRYGRQAII